MVQGVDAAVSMVVVGTAYHAPTARELETLRDVAVVVGDDGVILSVLPASDQKSTRLNSSH